MLLAIGWFSSVVILSLLLIYFAVCVVVAGVIDGMSGFKGALGEWLVFCWPVVLVVWVLAIPFVWLYQLGMFLGRFGK